MLTSSDWLSSSDVSRDAAEHVRPRSRSSRSSWSGSSPALPIVVTVWAIVASTRSQGLHEPRLVGRDALVEVPRGDRAADEARRHDARDDHPDDAEHQQARAHPPQVDPEPVHRP